MCAPTKYVGVSALALPCPDSQWTGLVKKAVFLHVFKTGGTSLQHWLAEHYENRFVPVDWISFRDLLNSNQSCIRSHDLIAGHMSARDAVRLSDSHTTFTVLRRPEAQLMSAIWHLATAHRLTGLEHERFTPASLPQLVEVAEAVAKTGDGAQWVFFAERPIKGGPIDLSDSRQRRDTTEAALEALEKIDVVGTTERMPETFRLFAKRLQIAPPQQQPHYRNADAGRHGLPPELREILKHHLEIDQQLYNAAVKRFKRDLSRMEPRWAFWR